ncbi:MAG: ATP-binding protein [Proteobacteria bacterium]|nr:ATP-binding protein [Pseudomonadota bacterium]
MTTTELTLNLLITDDEEGMRLGARRALERFAPTFQDLDKHVIYSVDTAATGEEAIEKLRAQSFDILLLDYKLPGLSGIEVLGVIQEMNLDLHVVMMTAYASLETAIFATKKGAFDFLAKPFTPEELRASVRGATRSHILLAQARQMAEEKRRMRFEFISVLSHELKSPIAAVEGYLELMRSGSIQDEATMQRVIERSLIRLGGMRKLIFDLLDLTRIESGTKARHIETLNLRDLIQSTIELLELQAQERGIAIAVNAPDAPLYDADKGELDIVLNNLVSNAIKYNRQGGRVDIDVKMSDDAVQISVADTGIGLTPDEEAKLFGEFVRIKNAKTRNIEGSGLGLSTVRKIIQLYNGDIRVDSTPDVGSTFIITLPRTASHSDDGDETPPNPKEVHP